MLFVILIVYVIILCKNTLGLVWTTIGQRWTKLSATTLPLGVTTKIVSLSVFHEKTGSQPQTEADRKRVKTNGTDIANPGVVNGFNQDVRDLRSLKTTR